MSTGPDTEQEGIPKSSMKLSCQIGRCRSVRRIHAGRQFFAKGLDRSRQPPLPFAAMEQSHADQGKRCLVASSPSYMNRLLFDVMPSALSRDWRRP